MTDYDLSVIVPAHNEGYHIRESLKLLIRELDKLGLKYGLIVVDDGSTDNTHSEALSSLRGKDNMRVLRYDKNKGKGHAIKHGSMIAHGDIVTFIDADMELHPKQIRALIDYMEKHSADVVVGSKLHPHSKVNYPLNRKVLSRIYQLMNFMLFGLSTRDTQAGLKIFKRKALQDIMRKVIVKRYAFDLELLVNAHHRGYKIVEAPIVLDYKRGFGRIGVGDMWNIFFDTCAIFYRLRILRYYDREEDE